MIENFEIKKNPFVLTICSGKGGVGKSIVASNLAYIASTQNLKTLIWDADQNFPNQHILFGVEPPLRIDEIYSGNLDINKTIFAIKDNLHILAGNPSSGVLKRQDSKLILDIYKQLLINTDYDLIILDTPAFSSDDVLQCCNIADLTAVIINDEPTSLLDAYGLLKILLSYIGNDYISLIVNNVIDLEDADEISGKLNMATTKFLKNEIGLLGFIPYERNIRQSILMQQIFARVYSNSETYLSFYNIFQKIKEKIEIAEEI